MNTTIAQGNHQSYRTAIVKSYYRVSGLQKLLAQISQDKTIGSELREELSGLVERRISTLVESRLACVN